MQLNRKGFATLALIIGFGLLAVASIFFGYEKLSKQQFGATVYTTQLSDTLGTFRNQVNSSTANLNAELVAVSTTINAYGNITAQNTPLANNLGGSGTTTTPVDLQYFGANGSRVGYINLVASSGITIATTTTSTIFSTPGFSTGLNNNWTGSNTFTSSTYLNGSSSINATTTLNANLVGAGFIPTLASAIVTSTLDFTTASTTFTTIGSSTANGQASTTITFLAQHRARITFTGAMANNGTGATYLTFTVDGTDVSAGSNGGITSANGSANEQNNMSASFVTIPLAAGSHTFRAQVRVDSGTLTVLGNSTGGMTEFSVLELYN